MCLEHNDHVGCNTGVWPAASLQAPSQPTAAKAGYGDGRVAGGGWNHRIRDTHQE